LGGYEDLVALLWDHGADVAATDVNGSTVLYWAAGEGREYVWQHREATRTRSRCWRGRHSTGQSKIHDAQIKFNILLGANREVTDQEIDKAAKDANVVSRL